jgi:SAM-dependent methyltransferase
VSQNIWGHKNIALHRQKRRAQVISSYLRRCNAKKILDIGSAEGYATSFISKVGEIVVGIEIDAEYLRVAKDKVKDAEFINASLGNLPFRNEFFDAVCVLEVMEHLDFDTQRKGLKEIDRILCPHGNLIISVPYRENIIQTKCIHCGKETPLYGHLCRLDESYINGILPPHQYRLSKTYRMPNVQMISCKRIFEPLRLRFWLFLNDILGVIRKGYWIILHYRKEL